jgi:suppressor of G2 allele of SKP1
MFTQLCAKAAQLDVSFPTGSGSNYDFTLLPLFAAIDTSQSTYSIMSTKIEIILRKAMSGLKWPALEGTAGETSSNPKDDDSSPHSQVTQPVDNSAQSKPPAYPTSSRKGAKNWDAVAKEALQKEKKDAKDGEAGSAAADDDDFDDEGDPLQGFFKKLYKDANPDTRRAMMKSYVESNGTALSTDWEDVGKKTVPINPPDGIEAKKWES